MIMLSKTKELIAKLKDNNSNVKKYIFIFLAILLYILNNPTINPVTSFVQLLEAVLGIWLANKY